MVEVFKEELETFEAKRDDLVQIAEGKFALIKGPEVIGFFDTQDSAYEEGARLFGNEPFLIKEIRREDPLIDIPAYSLGILHAGV